jgi:spore maturation protein A
MRRRNNRRMLNYIWFGLMAIALVVCMFTGNAAAVTKASVDSAKTAVEISLGLVGIMTLWLGIMRVAEQAGLVSLLGRALRPFSRLLFPEIPPEHPAIGAMIMNIAANMLGLSNAATPLGIKAMEELQELNTDKETASDAMVTFMVLNTAGIQFIPATIIGVLAAAGAKSPTSIIPTTLVATLCGGTAAVITAKILQRFTRQPAAENRQPEVSE